MPVAAASVERARRVRVHIRRSAVEPWQRLDSHTTRQANLVRRDDAFSFRDPMDRHPHPSLAMRLRASQAPVSIFDAPNFSSAMSRRLVTGIYRETSTYLLLETTMETRIKGTLQRLILGTVAASSFLFISVSLADKPDKVETRSAIVGFSDLNLSNP